MTKENQSRSRPALRGLFVMVLIGGMGAIVFQWSNRSKTPSEIERMQDGSMPIESAPLQTKREIVIGESSKIPEPEIAEPEISVSNGLLLPASKAVPQAEPEPVPGSPQNVGRQLALAASNGDTHVIAKLAEMVKTAQNNSQIAFNTEEERNEFVKNLYASVHAAFKVLSDEAASGNQNALDALSLAVQTKEIAAFAIGSLGTLAGLGNETALEALLNPQKFELPPSITLAALRPAANSGNQKAIDALAAVTLDETDKTQWIVVAAGLGNAAASGNEVAIDALIRILATGGPNERARAIAGLTQAAANQNAKAAEALRTMNVK